LGALLKESSDTGDKKRSFELQRSAALQGHLDAQVNVGISFLFGDGVGQSDSSATEWIRKAAVSGLPSAQCKLAELYSTGRGVELNDAEAASWFKKAADGGDVVAIRKLGLAYDEGRGVSKCGAEAYRLLIQAADLGDSDSQFKLGCMFIQNEGIPQGLDEVVRVRHAIIFFKLSAEQGNKVAEEIFLELKSTLPETDVLPPPPVALGSDQTAVLRSLLEAVHFHERQLDS
jgi:hypothetical protein